VRRHSKASTAGSTKTKATAALAALLAIGAVLFAAAPALAASVTDRPLLFSFNGSDTTAGTIEEMRVGMAVDESSGNLYALDLTNEVIDKFDASGVAANFSATGTSSLDGSETPGGEFEFNSGARIAVDDSPVNTGRIYVANNGNTVDAFSPAGAFLWRLSTAGNNGACGVAVDTEGHLWLGDSSAGRVREYAASGSPPAEIGSFAATNPCALDVARNGDVYVLDGGALDKYVGGVLSSTVDTGVEGIKGVAVDQSSLTGHVFSLHQDNFGSGDFFKEFDSSGALVGSFGLGVLYESFGIAYNPALDRVYVSQFVGPNSPVKTGTIKALGPIATGTTPDPTAEAASEIEISKAKLNGKVNPQSVPNAYFFEWKDSTSTFQWRRAQSSTPQSLAEDSLEHSVAFTPTGLKGDTTYQARLVGLNSATGLRSVSAPVTFTTATPSAPEVTIADPSAVSATSAEVSGTVDPKEDFGTTWRLQLSTDPACATGFSSQDEHKLESEASSPQAVAEELVGLLPNQHYCVRIAASNGGGTTNSAVKEFTTDPVAPTLAETAFAAPRTDTTARLNGLIDPEGADAAHPLTYRFEWSEDGGATWSALPDQQYSGGAREQVVVAEELPGLDPSTPYSYRFSAESDAGPASPQGGVKTFTTRSTAEMTPPKRGIELVNNPDKGNQNAVGAVNLSVSGISPSGNRALWTVGGGAPGGVSGIGNIFLAQRGGDGWHSRVLVPPVSQQVGGGELAYGILAATPDFSRSIFDVKEDLFFGNATEATRVRLDDSQNQQVLQTYSWSEENDGPGHLDMTDDGAHVLDINHASEQLEEIGDGSGEVISIMPDGTPSSCGLLEGPSFVGGETFKPGSTAGAALQWRRGYHMIATSDASIVYFEAKPNGECDKPWGLYVRDRQAGETKLIDPGGDGTDVSFVTAAPDGRLGYFATRSHLDPADTNQGIDLYRWDQSSEEATCLSCIVPDARIEKSTNENYVPILISRDFSHIYFESHRELVPGHPLTGSDLNLYVLSGGLVRFVAKNASFRSLLERSFSLLSDDGTTLLFRTHPEPHYTADRTDGGASEEVYLYEDGEGSLECISCAHGGSSGGFNESSGLVLSEDGSTAAFVTPVPLLAADVNGGRDAYEWRNGVQRLITNGVTEYPAAEFAQPKVQGIDADGSNVLFTVVDPHLTGFEQDGVGNLYDARIGGGFEPPSPPVHCSEDSCQGPLQAAPQAERSASSAFSGAGNEKSSSKPKRPCARKRGAAKRRCVRKHKRHTHRARAGHDAGRTK